MTQPKGWMPNVHKYVKKEVARMMATGIISTGTGIEGALGFSAKLVDTNEGMIVIRDFNPVRLAIRLRILADTKIASNAGQSSALCQLRDHERIAFELYDAEIRRVTGDKTIIWNVIDGNLRPAAKLDTLTKRAQAYAKRLKKEKTLPSGLKKSQLANRPPASDDWWQTHGDARTRYIIAPDEADRLIQYLLTFSCPSPRYDRPANSAFEDEQTRELLEILADYPPWHRILHTRDLDGPMHVTGHEVWFVLLTDWTGKTEPATFGIERDEFAARTRQYVEDYTSKFTKVPDPAPDLEALPVLATGATHLAGPTTASAQTGASNVLASQPDLPPLATEDQEPIRDSAFSNKALANLGGDSERHPCRCLFMPSLDRLPGFGDDQVRRHRLSAILGNDYTAGVGGITWPIAASGVLDGILGMAEADWADEGVLGTELSKVLANLAGRSDAAKSWRAHAPHGKVGKIEDRFGTLVGGKAAELIAAVRVIRCEEVELLPADARWKGNGRGPLAFGLSPPLCRSDPPTNSTQPSHAYVLRPAANHQIPADPAQPQALPTSVRNLRCDNNMQARRSIAAPGQQNFVAMRQSAWRVRPSAPGESDLVAMFDYGPEVGNFPPDEVERLLRSHDAEAGKPSDKQPADERDEEDDDGDEQEELEDDFAELDDEPEYKGRRPSASMRIEEIYGICSSPERDHQIARTFSDLTRPPYIAAPAPPQSQRTAGSDPSSSSTGRARARVGRSGAEQRAARRRRIHNGGRPVPLPSRRRARAGAATAAAAQSGGGAYGGSSAELSKAVKDDSSDSPSRPAQAAPLPTSEGPIHIPPEASVEPMLAWLPLAMDLGLPFVRMAVTTLIEQSIARGETGILRLAKFGGSRADLAQTMARIAAGAAKEATGGWFPGESVMPEDDELEAIRVALETGLIPPPSLGVSTYKEAFLPYDTNVNDFTRTHLLDDLAKLAASIGQNFAVNGPRVARQLLRSRHRDFDLSQLSKDALAGASPENSSRFGSELGALLADWFVNVPYSAARAQTGAADDDDDIHLPGTDPNRKRRQAGQEGYERMNRNTYGLGPVLDAAARAAIPRFELKQDADKRLDAIVARIAGGRDSVRHALRRDILALASCILAERDRYVQISLDLLAYTQINRIEAVSFQVLVDEGVHNLSGKRLRHSLLALTLKVRRLRGLSGTALLPYFDPSFWSVNVEGLLRECRRHHVASLGDYLERWCTELVGRLLPLVRQDKRKTSSCRTRIELFDILRRVFEVFHAEDDTPMTWIDAEDAAVPVRLRIKAADMQRVANVESILRVVFKSAGVMSYNMTRLSQQLEVMSILFARRFLPTNLIPTGHMRISSTKIYFTCVDVSKMTTKGMGMFGDNLDVGETWARVSQHPFTRLDLAQYDSRIRPVYERRTRDGRVYFDQIDRIAHRDAAAMVGSRVVPTVAPKPALTATRPQQRRERRERGCVHREFNPVDLRGRVRTARKQEKTRQGLPKSWGNLRFANRRNDAREFLAGTPLEKQHWMAVDTGLVVPLATRLSIPNRSKPGERHEANALYSRGALLEQQRVTSRLAAELNSTIEGQLDLKGAGGKDAPLQDPLIVTAVHAFKKMHEQYDQRGVRSSVNRKAEVRSVLSELVDLFVGGLDRFSPEELADHKFFVVVGADANLQDSQTVGAVTANVLLRQLPVEMRRRNLNFRIFLAPEYQTSQHCPRPRCTNTAGRRSRTRYIRRAAGGDEIRLLQCTRCRCVWHRDGAGAANIMAMAVCLLQTDGQLWGERWQS